MTTLGDPVIGALLNIERAYERYKEQPDADALDAFRFAISSLVLLACNLHKED
jgi:hypothetical protein